MQRPHAAFRTLLVLLLGSCATAGEPPHQAGIAPIEPTATPIALDIEDPGKIIIVHGSDCDESNQPDEQVPIEIPGSFALPDYANAGTVILRGWYLRYLAGDEEIQSISAVIKDINIAGNELTWVARGLIRDHNFDNGYQFCYHYTVLAWNSGLVDAIVDDANGNFSDVTHVNELSGDETTALSVLKSHVENPGFAGKRSVAILPRGFNLTWAQRVPSFFVCGLFPPFQRCPNDRELLQVAYNMDHSAAFVQTDDGSRADETVRAWESYFIFKDNDRRHSYSYDEHYSALAGDDVDTIVPRFSILPREDTSGCLRFDLDAVVRDVEVRDLPFDYAIPLMTGWDIGDNCSDVQIEEIGVRLENIEYEKDPAAPTGILRYRFVSDFNNMGHTARFKVNILGLNGREPADLLPVGPLCNLDAQNRLLVTVANVGPGDALPSSTRVDFGPGNAVEVATPALPAGFTGVVGPVVVPPPSQCGAGDCTFTITVDSASVVTETDEANNLATGACVG